jgi:hypothetical protein
VLSTGASSSCKPAGIREILHRPKKVSKSYRNYMSKAKRQKKPVNSNIIKKFRELVGINLDPDCNFKLFNSGWCYFGMTNKLKEFRFKFGNNLLGLNTRVSKFNRLISEDCTFCSITKNFPAPRENFAHLFFDCPQSHTTLCGFEDKYLADLHLDCREKKILLWFYGTTDNKLRKYNIFLQMTTTVVMFYIWDCKLRKCKQSLSSCLNFYFFYMDIVRKVSKTLRDEMQKTYLDLCRYWNGERPRGW